MENPLFKTEKTIGILLIIGGILLFIPYTILSIIFEYPVILRQDTGVILTKFHEGGSTLIWTWWAFAMVGLPLVEAYILIGQKTLFRPLGNCLGCCWLDCSNDWLVAVDFCSTRFSHSLRQWKRHG
jgi:hypothetical protein